MKCGGAMKKMKAGGQANLAKTMPGYNATTNPISMKKGGTKKSLPKAQDGKVVKTAAQLKKEGQILKAKGKALKEKGLAMKAKGLALKTKGANQANKLTPAELSALSHQKRGMGSIDFNPTYVKKSGPIKNEIGILTDAQKNQLKQHMAKASTLQKVYEALPNVGRVVGSSAADIPKGSKLEKQKLGGSKKTAIKRGSVKYKAGGATKNAKLAAVAPPKNKITRADVLTRILKKKK